MALLDQILGGAMRGGLGAGMGGGGLGGGLGGMLGGGARSGRKPGIGQTVAAGVILALLVKAARQQAARNAEPRTFDPRRQGHATPETGTGGGLGGILGGMGGGLGSILGGLGGAGALGGLVRQMQQKGYNQHASSWVGAGQNQPIEPHALADALGDETVDELQQQTGLPREQLLAELAHELPEAVNQVTPDGRLPDNDDELHRVTGVSG